MNEKSSQSYKYNNNIKEETKNCQFVRVFCSVTGMNELFLWLSLCDFCVTKRDEAIFILNDSEKYIMNNKHHHKYYMYIIWDKQIRVIFNRISYVIFILVILQEKKFIHFFFWILFWSIIQKLYLTEVEMSLLWVLRDFSCSFSSISVTNDAESCQKMNK